MSDTKGSAGRSANYIYAASGISTLSSIASVLGGVSSFKAQEEATTRNIISNIGRQMTTYEYEANRAKEDAALMDSMFADKMSARGLQAMKDEASLRAGAAETGTSGGTTEGAVREAYMNELLDAGIINSERQNSLGSILSGMEAKKLSIDNIVSSIGSEQTSFNSNSLLSGLSGGIGTLGATMGMLDKDSLAQLFNTQGAQ